MSCLIKYEGPQSTNPFAFKYYNPDAVVAGKPMREQLKFSLAWWHTLCADGTDMFGIGTQDKTFGGADPMEISKKRVDVGFALMEKLSIDYFCFHDRDLFPEDNLTLKEFHANLDVIVDYIEEKMKQTGKKLLWGTANCFSNPRYMNGAGTSPHPDSFAYAAAQIKKAMDITKRLGGTGYVFWGGREGYETLLNTDMKLELDNMARLLHLAVDYAEKIGFTGDLYIEPKPKEPTKHQYDFDAATVIGFLKTYGLDGKIKLNIEANHATLAGHTFQHELCVARINGAFGSIDANQGDMLLGWDTDQFPTNVYDAALCMLEVLRAGGFTNGGLNFDAKVRRASYQPEDWVAAFIAGMDTFALGLIIADRIIKDGRMDAFVAERYALWNEGIGKDITSGKATLEDLYNYAANLGTVKTVTHGGQEYLESVMNQIMFGMNGN
ncbi:MAG: xylose isomerase [Clostridia bacterium]|nr:xylose isomerase [Clostridia bacterium]